MSRPARTIAIAADPGIIAFVALILGAMAMGASPIFVRFAEVGPFTSAFWRVFLALPVLWLWARREQMAAPDAGAGLPVDRRALAAIGIAGLLSGRLLLPGPRQDRSLPRSPGDGGRPGHRQPWHNGPGSKYPRRT